MGETELSIPDGFAFVEGMTSDKRSDHITEEHCPVKRISLDVNGGCVTLPKLSVAVFEKLS